MAQHAILNHPDVALAGPTPRRSAGELSPRVKFLCVVACAAASWALVVAPFFLIG